MANLPIAPLRTAYDAGAPFSFIYGGMNSTEFLKHWPSQQSSRALDPQRTEYTRIYRDPKTGLEIRMRREWSIRIFPRSSGLFTSRTTARGLRPSSKTFRLSTLVSKETEMGSSFSTIIKARQQPRMTAEPYTTRRCRKNAGQLLSAKGGRPSNKDFPYFNLAWPGGGVIIVVGWPGQWAAKLTRDGGNGIQVRAGQELTHFKLLPGEEIRTPRIVLQFWQGEWRRSQNIWRRWMEAHNMPHPGGKLPPPQMAANTSREYVEMTEATDQDENNFIDLYLAKNFKPNYFWMDAGWYQSDGSWINTGTWEVEPKRYPHGLRAISDHAHANGIKTIVWFEPERVTKGTWLYEHHPEWLLTAPPNPGDQLYDNAWRLLNLAGNPQGAGEDDQPSSTQLITRSGHRIFIGQDFNMDPLN